MTSTSAALASALVAATSGAVDAPATIVDRQETPAMFVGDYHGCGYYRIKLPARVVGGRVSDWLDVRGAPDGTREYYGLGPTQLFQRPAVPALLDAVAEITRLGGNAWVEIDDDVWALSYQNAAAVGWPRPAQQCAAQAIRQAAGVTVSTAPLAGIVSKWNKNVAVIPNAVDPADFPQRVVRDPDIVRVGWFGSYTHGTDLTLALSALVSVARRPGVELHFGGYDPLAGRSRDPRETGWREQDGVRYYYHGWADEMRQHYTNIAALDVAVAPLTSVAFNESKSAIKWIEHSMVGTPMVLSRARPYADAVRHGETGFLAKTPADFYKYLTLLVTNRQLREDIGRAAYREVSTRHTIQARANLWREVLCP
ncbi:MAG: glycosyltransferase family 4 protein [Thermomicrobiales bacterium]